MAARREGKPHRANEEASERRTVGGARRRMVSAPGFRRVFAALTRDSQDWVAVVSRTGQLRMCGGSVATLLGQLPEELDGTSFVQGVDSTDVPAVSQALKDAAEQGPGGTVEVEYSRQHRNGTLVRLRTTFTNRLGDEAVHGLVATTREAPTPGGTESRAQFVERLRSVVDQRTRPYALASVELRNLEQVSNARGHGAARALRSAVARRLRAGVQPTDTVAHTGRHSFAVLFDGMDDDGRARAAVEKLHARLRAPFPIGGVELVVDAGIGYVTSRRLYELAEEALSDAEIAAQRAGGQRSHMYESAMRLEDQRNVAIAAALPRALQRGELSLRYQPIVELPGGRVVGAEALMRWNHPKLGAVSPVEFIPLAERFDWILPLDRWALEEATREVGTWNVADDFKLSVNLSAQHLDDPALPAAVARALGASGLRPEQLQLEVTETAVMTDADASSEALHTLRALGIKLAIDDFGTGYASFGQLADLPFDVLKIDKSMVDRLGSERSVVPGVVAMAHQLGLLVVAEGVETDEQRVALEALGADFAQGYLFAKPVSPVSIRKLL